MELPSEDEISEAVVELFRKVDRSYPQELLSALVPVDRTLEPGYKSITYVVEDEMNEVCTFVKDFKILLDEIQNNESLKTRIKIVIYCHIMEADFPFIVLWNLLRVLDRKLCEWTFSRITKKRKKSVCKYPREKISELESLSGKAGLTIGEVIGKLWRDDLRNAFSHSQYFLSDKWFIGTRKLSPTSREGTRIRNGIATYSLEEIDALYQGAYNLLFAFVQVYKDYIRTYKDRNVHKIQAGSIRWDERGTWNWA